MPYCPGMSESCSVSRKLDRLVSYDDAVLLDELRRVAASLPEGPVTRATSDGERGKQRLTCSAVRRMA